MLRRSVVITGVGLATPLGTDWARFGELLYGGAAGFETLTTRHSTTLPLARVAGDGDAAPSRSEASLADRGGLLALAAGTRALQHAGLNPADTALRGMALYLGSGAGPSQSVDDAFTALHQTGRLSGLTLLRCLPNGAAAGLAIRLGMQGGSHTQASACASSTLAIGEAVRAIRHGYLDLALAGGAEAPLGEGNLKAWDMLRVLAPPGSDPSLACRPFDRHRAGLVLGEGAVLFVLESAQHAQSRGARVLAEILGFGTRCDARHWTEPDVQGQVDAMLATLQDAGLKPEDIAAINAHGTATVVGDAVEAASVSRVFGRGAGAPPISSTKATHGHLLGASGAIELAAAIHTLQRRLVPPTRNFHQAEPDCGLNLVAHEARPCRPGRAVLSNSFAFGGINACLAVAQPGVHG